MIRRRRDLASAEIHDSAVDICWQLWRLPELARSRRIAAYMPVSGEVDCRPFIDAALARRRQVYLPVLHRGALMFARYESETPLALNRYGIPEPQAKRRDLISASMLDIVLTPLVAFDRTGTRLGMGGGYYDRGFRFLRSRREWLNPKLLGVAYAFQQVEKLQRRPWDIPLFAAVTETSVQRF